MLNVEDYEGTLNILGKEWTVKIDGEMPEGTMGTCDYTTRTIRLTDFNNYITGDYFDYERPIEMANRTFRHEIIHACFYELGHDDYGSDELLVDMLAFKLPQLFEIFDEECLLWWGGVKWCF